MIICDEIINAADTVSTNGSANVMSTVYCVNKFSKQKIKIWNGVLYVYYILYIYIYILYITKKHSLFLFDNIYFRILFDSFVRLTENLELYNYMKLNSIPW